MARPIKQDKKIPISVKLPPYIIKWMDKQPDSRAVLIEDAIKQLSLDTAFAKEMELDPEFQDSCKTLF